MRPQSLHIIGSLFTVVLAGFPSAPDDLIKINAGDSSISYKQTTICETKARGFAGYVHLPASALGEIQPLEQYNVSIFFWYFEARQHPENAKTAIYLAGGPGQSSLYGATSGGGPCTVLPNSNGTKYNPHAWNEHVNVLYVDQPVGAGFSYDKLVNSTQDLLAEQDSIIAIDDYDSEPIPAESTTFLYGTFSSQNLNRTASTTAVAARTLWQFAQVWFSSFAEYKTQDKSISIWGNSYGAYYAPVSAEHFARQNKKIQSGELKGTMLNIDAVGWTNGCTDMLYQAEWFPDMAYNNTYGLEAISRDTFNAAKSDYSKPGGCRDLMLKCRELGDLNDPNELSIDPTVNAVCAQATIYCATAVIQPYVYSGRSRYDIAHFQPDPSPSQHHIGFFNRAWVQRELGVPLNFTANSNNVFSAFYANGDPFRTAGMKSIEYLLSIGVKVAMIYGDRDYTCPWNGGEQLSLQANWTGAEIFRGAGYASIRTTSCDSGGVVRQHGSLSFSRVFDAGHDAAAYQPQLVHQIFDRVMRDQDVASGTQDTSGSDGSRYATAGPSSVFGWKNVLPEPPGVDCNLYAVSSSCTMEQYAALQNGTAVLNDFRVVSPA
ncbi:unnamed protein product [Zymoseptoria tritici ST99CH_3D1]|nr:unnamed protein product [Zymoseptoria tritici ST99CH_3D1]